MSKEIAIHKMVDQVFDKGATSVIDEIAEERNFIVKALKHYIETDEVWQQFVDNKEMRKQFITSIQALTLQELETNALIELVTIKQGAE